MGAASGPVLTEPSPISPTSLTPARAISAKSSSTIPSSRIGAPACTLTPAGRKFAYALAATMASALSRRELTGRAFNVAGDVTMKASEYVQILAALSRRDVQLRPRTLAGWWALEHFGWAVKAVGRKANNSALSWRELNYRTGASTLDCQGTKDALDWSPEADRDRFIYRGIRAALRP